MGDSPTADAVLPKGRVSKDTFFDQPIFLQLPDLPNSTVTSSLAPGFGWAPSLPHMSSLKFTREEINNMILRAKCGVKTGDIQKEAHMLFYLGVVAENKKHYKKVEPADEVHQDVQGLLQHRQTAQ